VREYRTSDGDTVEGIAWRVYGTQGGRVTEQLLDANPGLADYGPQLPPNVLVFLPAIDTTAKAAGTRLWD
jgi:phage tail protein X